MMLLNALHGGSISTPQCQRRRHGVAVRAASETHDARSKHTIETRDSAPSPLGLTTLDTAVPLKSPFHTGGAHITTSGATASLTGAPLLTEKTVYVCVLAVSTCSTSMHTPTHHTMPRSFAMASQPGTQRAASRGRPTIPLSRPRVANKPHGAATPSSASPLTVASQVPSHVLLPPRISYGPIARGPLLHWMHFEKPTWAFSRACAMVRTSVCKPTHVVHTCTHWSACLIYSTPPFWCALTCVSHTTQPMQHSSIQTCIAAGGNSRQHFALMDGTRWWKSLEKHDWHGGRFSMPLDPYILLSHTSMLTLGVMTACVGVQHVHHQLCCYIVPRSILRAFLCVALGLPPAAFRAGIMMCACVLPGVRRAMCKTCQ